MPILGSDFSVDCARGLLDDSLDSRTYPRSCSRVSAASDADANSNTASNTASTAIPDANSNACASERRLDNAALFDAGQSDTRHPSE